MKSLLRQSIFASTLILALSAPSLVKAETNAPVYDRAANNSIGITAGNATGCRYEIKDKNGKVVLSGKIKSGKTFYIATGKLGRGNYSFSINGNTLQEFIIK